MDTKGASGGPRRSPSVRIEVAHEVPQVPELRELLGWDGHVERFSDLLDECDRIHRGDAGVAEPDVEVRLPTKVQVLVKEFSDAVFSR